jgi:hypothetical protein
MSFFNSLLEKHNLQRHDGRSLWKYNVSNIDLQNLISKINISRPLLIDPRDATIYYSQWWKKNYNGGKPSKDEIFKSITVANLNNFDSDDFYKLAIKGAQILGVKWIKKQNTLYFRTLLLQGGLPVAHIAANQGYYQNFLLAVLEEQPETIEDFIFNPAIINLLPKSSQNDIIYENCLEIVKSILNDENEYDELLDSDDVIQSISNELKIRKRTLIKKQRISKPKNYWLMNFQNESINIYLKIGLADTYDNDSLSSILGFEICEREYQFFLNDDLICVFRKMANGKFKTDWYSQQDREWNLDDKLPYTYVIHNNEKTEVKDFVQIIPSIYEPSLWDKYSETEWRLVKGTTTSNSEAALLFPVEWYSNLHSRPLSIYGNQLFWLTFEGKIELTNDSQTNKYLSAVDSFNWTIESNKPSWMIKANMAVVQNMPRIFVYDETDKLIPREKFTVWIKKHKSSETWQDLSRLSFLPIGCIDLKIEKDELIAYDMFFNIGNIQLKYVKKSIDHAELQLKNKETFKFTLDDSAILDIKSENDIYILDVNTEHGQIPTNIKGSLGHKNHKKLFFELEAPFEGMIMTDKDGKIIPETQTLAISNLYGIRILRSANTETFIRIKNSLKTDVKITKELKEVSQPLIAFKDEIVRLYYLADAMNYKNKVTLELIEGRNTKTYEISGFSHTLNVENQNENKVCLYDSNDELNLYAVPLNCASKSIELIPLLNNGASYTIPSTEISSQFIVISTKEMESQLMPRFICTDENFIGIDKNERIEQYYVQLNDGNLKDEIWKRTLTYFKICTKHDLPFSTFDELRAISRSSLVASRAFLLFGINSENFDDFIQKYIPEMEQDLGFCFHWIKISDWEDALNETNELTSNQYITEISSLITSYMLENELTELLQFMNGNPRNISRIYNADISTLRAKLGERVLNELPIYTPKTTKKYGIPIEQHLQVKLLLRSPIAVAESINGIQKEYSIWAGNDHRESIRRNIQYSQYLNPEFYNRVILHALKNN